MIDLHDCYWAGGLGTYGSARGALVSDPSTDSVLAAWKTKWSRDPLPWPQDGQGQTTWDSLDAVLLPLGLSSGQSMATMKAQLLAAAATVGQSLIAQVMPTPARQTAYLCLVELVTAAGDAVPTNSTQLTKFNALASAYGITGTALAAAVVALRDAILDGATAELVLDAAATVATTSAQLATALATFETAVAAVVAEANSASLPVPIVAPAAISIKGINA